MLLTLLRDAKFNFTVLEDNLLFVNVTITKPESILLTPAIDMNSPIHAEYRPPELPKAECLLSTEHLGASQQGMLGTVTRVKHRTSKGDPQMEFGIGTQVPLYW